MVLPIKKENDNNNIIQLSIVDGRLGKKPKVRYNKDGSVDKRHPNKVKGVSSEVYGFDTEEIKRMIEVFDKHIENAANNNQKQIAWRNKTLFIVGINLSLRISDLITLKWNFFLKDDMTFKDFYKIQPKKTKRCGKFVTLYFNDSIKKSIMQYIKKYPIEDMNDFVFKSRKGTGAITENSVWRIIVDAANEAKIEFNVGTHSLRKTFGKQVFNKAEDKEKALILLMIIFNHSSVTITKQYIGSMNEEIEDVFNELNLGIDFI